jgi:hypothetical protein
MTMLVDIDTNRREAFGERDAFLERLLDLFVVQGRRDYRPAGGGKRWSRRPRT